MSSNLCEPPANIPNELLFFEYKVEEQGSFEVVDNKVFVGDAGFTKEEALNIIHGQDNHGFIFENVSRGTWDFYFVVHNNEDNFNRYLVAKCRNQDYKDGWHILPNLKPQYPLVGIYDFNKLQSTLKNLLETGKLKDNMVRIHSKLINRHIKDKEANKIGACFDIDLEPTEIEVLFKRNMFGEISLIRLSSVCDEEDNL